MAGRRYTAKDKTKAIAALKRSAVAGMPKLREVARTLDIPRGTLDRWWRARDAGAPPKRKAPAKKRPHKAKPKAEPVPERRPDQLAILDGLIDEARTLMEEARGVHAYQPVVALFRQVAAFEVRRAKIEGELAPKDDPNDLPEEEYMELLRVEAEEMPLHYLDVFVAALLQRRGLRLVQIT